MVRGHLATCGDCEATAFNELRPAAVAPRGGPRLHPAARHLAQGRPGAAAPRLRPVALATRGDSAGARVSEPSCVCEVSASANGGNVANTQRNLTVLRKTE